MPSGVYPRTEKHKHSEATKEYLRLINTGRSNPMYGRTTTEKQRASARKSITGNKYRLGLPAWNKGTNLSGMKGKQHLDSTKLKMSMAHIGKPNLKIRGEKHHNWKGGVSFDAQHVSHVKNQRNRFKAQSSGSHTKDEWELLKKQFNFTCLGCLRSEPEISLTKDHVIPFSLMGSDDIENIQPLCMGCNIKKASKCTDFRPLQV